MDDEVCFRGSEISMVDERPFPCQEPVIKGYGTSGTVPGIAELDTEEGVEVMSVHQR